MTIAPLAAPAAVVLDGPSIWEQGKSISVVLKTDSPTQVNSLFINAPLEPFPEDPAAVPYSSFAAVLQLLNLPVETVPAFLAPPVCDRDAIGDICVYFNTSPPVLPADTILMRWDYLVRPDAPVGPINFDFNLFIEADSGAGNGPVTWPQDKHFEVVSAQVSDVPEPATVALTLAGLAILGATVRRRTRSA